MKISTSLIAFIIIFIALLTCALFLNKKFYQNGYTYKGFQPNYFRPNARIKCSPVTGKPGLGCNYVYD